MSNTAQRYCVIWYAMVAKTRQVERTRAAIQTAFAELVFTSRYRDIRMTDVAQSANVGRSTLYMHYPDKDAILLDNMAPLLSDLARATEGNSAVDCIEAVLCHIWLHRDRGRVVLFDLTGQKLEAALAERIIATLPSIPTQPAPPFVANMVAAAIFAVLRTWMRGEASGNAPDIANNLCRSSRALVTSVR